jgi:putative phosphonate metabolism protein
MRFAIYFTPPADDPLAVCASRWLGRDAFTGALLEQAEVSAFDRAEIAELTAEPRRYGFHATLKAPFELAPGMRPEQLIESFDHFAATTSGVSLPAITLGQLGPFFALVPSDWSPQLNDLADACVRHFEPFRAPLGADDIQRRKPDSLSASQRQHLLEWGYPYVFEDFRFHMTLSGQVPAQQRPAMKAVLSDVFADHIDRPLGVSHLALFSEPERGAPFVLTRIASLRPVLQRNIA